MKTRLRSALSFAMVSLFGLAGCGANPVAGPGVACTTEARSSVTAKVVDKTGAIVSDAVVTFSVDGGAAEMCETFPDGTGYVCGHERAGQFTVSATKGADTKTQTVTVKKTDDGCHVDSQSITITLGA
jgi:hypothetical protein